MRTEDNDVTPHDNIEIINIINFYALAIDTQRWDLFDRVFTDDVDADYDGGAKWHNLATFKPEFAAYHDPFDGTLHTMTNHQVIVDGDHASAMTHGHWRLIRNGLDGGDFWQVDGWYNDRLARTGAGWRITDRACRIIWWGGNPRVNETVPGVTFDLHSTSLRREASAGTVWYLDAITAFR